MSLIANLLFNLLPSHDDAHHASADAFGLPVVSTILVATIGFLSCLLFTSHVILPMQEDELRLIDAFCYFSIVGSLLALIVLRSSYPVAYVLQIYIAVLAIGLASSSLYSGGYASPANICFIVLPIVALFGIGPMAGLCWFAVMLLVLVLECVAGYFGTLPDSVVVAEDAHVAIFVAILSSYVFLFAVVLYYKKSATRLLEFYKHESSKYFYIANHDNLTGVASRRCFLEALDKAVTEAKDLNAQFCVLFFDLNEFKIVNDRYGHNIGDQILTVFSRRLFANTRSYNLVGRIGGDEFAVLLENLSDEETIKQRIEDYGGALSRPLHLNGEEILISASIGYAIYPLDGQNSRTLLHTADHKMYREKRLFYSEKAASAFSKK